MFGLVSDHQQRAGGERERPSDHQEAPSIQEGQVI